MKTIYLSFTISLFLMLTGFQVKCNDCEIVEGLFKQKQVLQYLHPEIKNRTILYLEENKYCNINKQLLDNLNLKTISSKKIIKYKNRIYITKVVKKEGVITKINLYYPMENVSIVAELNGKEYKITTFEM